MRLSLPDLRCQYRPCGNTNCSSATPSSEATGQYRPCGKAGSKPQCRSHGVRAFSKNCANGKVPLVDSRSDLMHYQYRLSVLRWNAGLARKTDTQIIPAACSRFHAVILQEAGDHVPNISELVYTYTDGDDLAILRNKDKFVSSPSPKPDSPTVTFCSVHLHKKVAKTRDASTSPLHRIREHMVHYSIDFIGGDFNTSAFSTVGVVVLRHRVRGSRQLSLVGPCRLGRDLSSMHGLHHHAAAPHAPGGSIHTVASSSTTLTWAAGEQVRKRLRKRFGQQAPSSTATSSIMPTTAQIDATQHFATTVHAHFSPRPLIGSMPVRPASAPVRTNTLREYR